MDEQLNEAGKEIIDKGEREGKSRDREMIQCKKERDNEKRLGKSSKQKKKRR